MAEPRVRQIKIKTGVAKQQEEKIEKMRAEDGENYDIKKQVKLYHNNNLEETEEYKEARLVLDSVKLEA
uniref:Tubulin-specific chaperone A n=1 Tax=Rhinopithecus bieti TaxID=61621 RepID=A0A2K6KYF5_RHIBE